MDKLKSCPFCGGEAEVEKCILSRRYTVSCLTCNAIMFKTYTTIEDAIKAWNSHWW